MKAYRNIHKKPVNVMNDKKAKKPLWKKMLIGTVAGTLLISTAGAVLTGVVWNGQDALDEIEANVFDFVNDSQKQVTDLQNQIKDKQETVNRLIEERDKLLGQIETKSNEIAKITAELTKANETNEANKNKITELEAQLKAAQDELAGLENNYEQKDEQLQELNNTIQNLQQQLQESLVENNNKDGIIQELQEQLNKANVEVEETKNNVNEMLGKNGEQPAPDEDQSTPDEEQQTSTVTYTPQDIIDGRKIIAKNQTVNFFDYTIKVSDDQYSITKNGVEYKSGSITSSDAEVVMWHDPAGTYITFNVVYEYGGGSESDDSPGRMESVPLMNVLTKGDIPEYGGTGLILGVSDYGDTCYFEGYYVTLDRTEKTVTITKDGEVLATYQDASAGNVTMQLNWGGQEEVALFINENRVYDFKY